MKRRDFILITTAGAFGISIPSYYYYRDLEYEPELAIPASLSLIWGVKTIAEIGAKYRLQIPDEGSQRVLVSLLTLPGGGFDERIINDFETNYTVVVDGWILSVTEARQCALASMEQPQ